MKKYSILLRVLYSLAACLGILFFPAWIVLGMCLCGFFLFPKYVEGIILCVLIDGLYSFSGSTPQPGLYTVIGMLVFIIMRYLRTRLSWYSK